MKHELLDALCYYLLLVLVSGFPLYVLYRTSS